MEDDQIYRVVQSVTPDPPTHAAVQVQGVDGNTVVYVFPNGMESFAAEYNASCIQLDAEVVLYYSRDNQRWEALEDKAPPTSAVTPFRPRGKSPSTPEE